MDDSKVFLRSGELARLGGISPDTLRHYERVGVLQSPRRSENNYRIYPPEAADRIRLVRHALSIGFSLHELSQILRVREQGGFPCRQVKALVEDRLRRLDSEIAQMRELRSSLQELLKDWRKRLDETPDGHPARLLETLPAIQKKGKHDEDTRTRFARRAARDRSGRSQEGRG